MDSFDNTICIFIDLLGFSALTIEEFQQNSYKSFEQVREIIKNFINLHDEPDENRLNYYSFYSDSMIWIFSYNHDLLQTVYPCEFDACTNKIDGSLFFLLMNLIEHGFFFRGGIASGKTIIGDTKSTVNGRHIYTENILFSESLVYAASIEKKITYPVIGLSEENLFSSLDNKGYGNSYVGQFKHINKLSNIDDAIIQDESYFLDHLEMLIFHFSEDTILFDMLELHKANIINGLSLSKDQSILQKYNFLKKYHNYSVNKLLDQNSEFYGRFEDLIIN